MQPSCCANRCVPAAAPAPGCAAQPGPPSLLPQSALPPPGGLRPAVGGQTPGSIQREPWSPGGCKAQTPSLGGCACSPTCPPHTQPRGGRQAPGVLRDHGLEMPGNVPTATTNQQSGLPQRPGHSLLGIQDSGRAESHGGARLGDTPRGGGHWGARDACGHAHPSWVPVCCAGSQEPPSGGMRPRDPSPLLSEWAPTLVPWGHCSGLGRGVSEDRPRQSIAADNRKLPPTHTRSCYLGGRS